MDADTEDEVEDPASVGKHRTGAASDARAEVGIESGAAAQYGKFGKFCRHGGRVEWRRAGRRAFGDRIKDKGEALVEFGAEVDYRHRGWRIMRTRDGRSDGA